MTEEERRKKVLELLGRGAPTVSSPISGVLPPPVDTSMPIAPYPAVQPQLAGPPPGSVEEAQARQLEAQSAPPLPPRGVKENLVSGIRAGLEGFAGGYTGGPGYFERQQVRDVQERQREQDLLSRAKELRGEGLKKQEMATTAANIAEDNRRQAEQFAMQKKIQEQQLELGKYLTTPKGAVTSKVTPTGLQPEVQVPEETKPVNTSNYSRDTQLYQGKPTDVMSDLDPQSPTFGKTFIQTPTGLQDVSGQTQHYEKPTQSPNEAVMDLRRQSALDRIRQQYNAHPSVRKFQTVASGLEFAKGVDPKTNNPADDQGMIYAFAKAMDPESVVREGEYATVQKYSQSWADRFGFDIRRLYSNSKFLTPEAIQNMKATIEARAKPEYQLYQHTLADFRNDVERVVPGGGQEYIPDYGQSFAKPPEMSKTQPGGQTAPAPAQTERRVINGVTYQKVPGGWSRVQQ